MSLALVTDRSRPGTPITTQPGGDAICHEVYSRDISTADVVRDVSVLIAEQIAALREPSAYLTAASCGVIHRGVCGPPSPTAVLGDGAFAR